MCVFQAVEGLSRQSRSQQGLPGGIVHIVYLCAFILPPGDSLSSLDALNLLPPIITTHPDGTCEVQDPGPNLYADLSAAEQEHWIAQLKPKASAALFGSGPTYAGWREVPCSYLICEHDKAIPLTAQQYMVSRAVAEGAEMYTETCSASHSPFLSQPEVVVALVERAAAVSLRTA